MVIFNSYVKLPEGISHIISSLYSHNVVGFIAIWCNLSNDFIHIQLISQLNPYILSVSFQFLIG